MSFIDRIHMFDVNSLCYPSKTYFTFHDRQLSTEEAFEIGAWLRGSGFMTRLCNPPFHLYH